MAQRKKKTKAGDRPLMDMGGAKKARKGGTYMDRKADDDRKDAKAHHLDRGLTSAKKLVSTMAKAIAHGCASNSDDVKAMVLDEVADIGNEVRDDSRAALRSAKREKRNVQK